MAGTNNARGREEGERKNVVVKEARVENMATTTGDTNGKLAIPEGQSIKDHWSYSTYLFIINNY